MITLKFSGVRIFRIVTVGDNSHLIAPEFLIKRSDYSSMSVLSKERHLIRKKAN